MVKVAFPVLLLLVFLALVRPLGEWTRPVTATVDCTRVGRADMPALERCAEIRPDDLELVRALGGAHEIAGEWERAEAIYRRGLEIDPEDGDIRVRLGYLLLRRGDREAARHQGRAALALQPGRPAAIELLRRASASESDE